MATKQKKVYEVEMGILESGKDGGDIQNYQKYTITADDAKDAIRVIERDFKFVKGEYVVGIKVIATLD
jgi:hypothetical protein